MPDDDEARRKALRDQQSLEEWLRQNRAEHARRDLIDAAPQTDKGTATQTQLEALDRAAHSEAVQSRQKLFSPDDEKRLGERITDYAELYPTPEAWEQSFPHVTPPRDPDLRAQYDDLAGFQKEAATVNEAQKANVDKALAKAEITDKIGGASDVAARPQPNEPTPIDKSREVGQDLHKAGVTMDKE